MSTKDLHVAYVRDTEILRAALTYHCEAVARMKDNRMRRIAGLKMQRDAALDALASEHIPDLRPHTMEKLRAFAPSFFTAGIEGILSRIEREQPSGWSRAFFFFFRPRRLRSVTDADVAGIQSLFKRYVIAIDPKPDWCEDIGSFDSSIRDGEEEIVHLSKEHDNSMARLARLVELRGTDVMRLDQRVIDSVKTSAENLREQGRRYRDDEDHGLHLIDPWLLAHLSGLDAEDDAQSGVLPFPSDGGPSSSV